jgi:hypothetical protein
MLRRLGVERHHLHFQRMAEPDSALYANTYRLHNRLLRPWLECALDPECLAPPGAQADGCDLTRRPRYRYAGCHRYDASAFNVILGQMFYFDDTAYIPSTLMFHREILVPTSPQHVHPISSEAQLKSRRHRSRVHDAVKWKVLEADRNSQPILFKRT